MPKREDSAEAMPATSGCHVVIDCATRRNFQLFRTNPDYVRLTGLVSLNVVKGQLGTYSAGTMMVFPQLTPKGVALGAGRAWPSYVTARNPVGAAMLKQVDAIRMQTLPADDYFCRVVLSAPWSFFIGFSVIIGAHFNAATLIEWPAPLKRRGKAVDHPAEAMVPEQRTSTEDATADIPAPKEVEAR